MLIVLCWVQHKEEQYTACMGQKEKSWKYLGSDLHAAGKNFADNTNTFFKKLVFIANLNRN